MPALIKVVAAIAIAWAALAVAAYLGQRRLIYFPSRTRVPPVAAGLVGVTERVLDTPDGEHVLAWYGRSQPEQPTLLYFHGNGGSLFERAERIRRFMSAGWGVYMMTYRGYGGSSGRPSEAANVADASLAYADLLAQGVPAEKIILYGESLGTAMAARLAAERPAAALVLEAPFTSAVAVGARAYPFLPVSLLMIDRYETSSLIARVHMPLLILHGERDLTIPVAMGRELFRLANEPKRLVIFPNGGHNDLYLGDNDAMRAVKEWISRLPT